MHCILFFSFLSRVLLFLLTHLSVCLSSHSVMLTGPITLDDVNEALRVNREIQERLQQNCRRFSERIDRMETLCEALCKVQCSLSVRRKLSCKRRRASFSSSTLSSSLPLRTVNYLKAHHNRTSGFDPFHDAGVYVEGGIPRYAKVPLTKDEVRWQEAMLAFPQLQRERYVRANRECSVEVDVLSKKERHALAEAVRSYTGRPCGDSFWKALAPHCKSRFDIASKYVALQARKNTTLRTAGEALAPLGDVERFCAMRDAMQHHVGDLSEMFVSYAANLASCARARVYAEEAEGNSYVSFPPYLWETRRNFQRMIEPIINSAKSSTDPANDVEHLDDVPLLELYSSRAKDKPSLLHLTMCLLALKGDVLGENTTLTAVERVFLSNHGGAALSMKDLMELKI